MYPFRGHYIFNISTEAEGIPAYVLIYEVEIDKKRYGPIKLVEELRTDKVLTENL
jgi:3-methyladenine DNA glycosylase Mpg